jgi:hypothetical protein
MDLSEEGGYFRSDNFTSNEDAFQYVIPALQERTKPGGVYVGVGPEQNFTYIVATRPKIVFITDIRRQNMLELLIYKSLFELSSDRADFLSRLFSRKRPAGLDASSSAEKLFQAFSTSPPDSALLKENLRAVMDHITKKHRFPLMADDADRIEYVYNAFFLGVVNMGPRVSGGRGQSTYAELMSATDLAGQHRSYLATEDNFRFIQDLQKKNLIVPLVGDFAGPKALRSIGQYVRDHGAAVTVFYTSNVEQYLFQDPDNWKRFYENVATLPMDASSTFIRSLGSNGPTVSIRASGGRWTSLLCSIADLVREYNAGRIQSYRDVIVLSDKQTP